MFKITCAIKGQGSISHVVTMYSRLHAARKYAYYKFNKELGHCDMPVNLAVCLAREIRNHALLTLGIFELTLTFLDTMEQNLEKEYRLE